MKNNVAESWLGTAVATVVGVSVGEWIGLIVSIVCGLASLAFTIYKWAREARKDGKITAEEVGDLIEKVSDEIKDISDNINKGENKHE